jgi:hypothetical protein
MGRAVHGFDILARMPRNRERIRSRERAEQAFARHVRIQGSSLVATDRAVAGFRIRVYSRELGSRRFGSGHARSRNCL